MNELAQVYTYPNSAKCLAKSAKHVQNWIQWQIIQQNVVLSVVGAQEQLVLSVIRKTSSAGNLCGDIRPNFSLKRYT